jgi:uroporphyrinogen decarboxylase
MDSRRLVYQTLEFDHPGRIPRDLWVLPWAEDHYPRELAEIRRRFPSDIVTAPACLIHPPSTEGGQYEIGTYVDEWGCVFYNKQRGVIGEPKEPRLKTWDDLDQFQPPAGTLSVDIRQVNAFCRASDGFVLSGCCARPFERLQFLRTSEQIYFDLGEQAPGLFTLLDRVHQHYLKEMELWAQTEVDALSFMDDWGAQRALLISPRMWRRIFKPLYKDYIDLAHAHGKKAFMHSDGCTADIIPDLVELGLDALNCQLFTMDIETLGKQFAGKITFWGEIDRQRLLPFGTPAEVDQAVRRVNRAFYRDGGVIAQCEFGAGARPENVAQVYATWDALR